MKKVFFVLLMVAGGFIAQAQTETTTPGFKFGAGVNLGIPASNMEGSSIGAGIDLAGHYSFSDKLALTADAGYNRIFAKDNGLDVNLIPIRAGLRFYPSSQFFIGGKAGIGILSAKDVDSESNFGYSFGAGYVMDNTWEIGASYDGYSKDGNSFGLVGIRLGYWFGQ